MKEDLFTVHIVSCTDVLDKDDLLNVYHRDNSAHVVYRTFNGTFLYYVFPWPVQWDNVPIQKSDGIKILKYCMDSHLVKIQKKGGKK